MTLRIILLMALAFLGTRALALEPGASQTAAAESHVAGSPSASTIYVDERSDDGIEVPLPDTVTGPRSPAAEPCSAIPMPHVADATGRGHCSSSGCTAGACSHCFREVVLPPSNGPPARRFH